MFLLCSIYNPCPPKRGPVHDGEPGWEGCGPMGCGKRSLRPSGLPEHPRSFKKAGPREWALCGRLTVQSVSPFGEIDLWVKVRVRVSVLSRQGTPRAQLARQMIRFKHPSRVGRPDAYFATLSQSHLAEGLLARPSLPGSGRPRPTDPVPQSQVCTPNSKPGSSIGKAFPSPTR
jgi:hypothetical protein